MPSGWNHSSTQELQNLETLQGNQDQNTSGGHKCTISMMHKPRGRLSTSRTNNKLPGLWKRPWKSTIEYLLHDLPSGSSHLAAYAMGEALSPIFGSRLHMSQRCAKQVAFTGLLTPEPWVSLSQGKVGANGALKTDFCHKASSQTAFG